MKELTKSEEQIMQILWKLKAGFVKDVIERFPAPKPAYNTVSTIIRILEEKGFIDHKTYGRTHQYYPVIDKNEYRKLYFHKFFKNYFNSSLKNMVSFLSNDSELSIIEIEELKAEMDKILEEKRNKSL